MNEYPDVLPVTHPVPLRIIPRRGHREYMVLGRATTPVRLTRVERDAIAPSIPVDVAGGMGVLQARIDGRVFTKARAPDGPGGTRPDFAAFLAGAMAGERTTQLAKAFAGTPVSARLQCHDGSGRDWPFRDVDHRGEEGHLEGARTVVHDGTERARASLQEFFDANVRVLGGTLFVDTGGPLFVPTYDRHGSLRYRTEPFPRMRGLPADAPAGPFARADLARVEAERLAALRRAIGSDGLPDAERTVPGIPVHSSVGAGVATDTDVLFANKAPGTLLDMLAPAIRAGSRGPMGEPSTREGIERLRWMALMGSVGGVAAHEAAAVVAHVREVAMWGLAMPQVNKGGAEGLVALREHCAEWVLPRLSGAHPVLDRDDVEALGALAP